MSTAAITKPPAGYDPGVYNSSDQSSGSASGSPPPLIPPPTNPLAQEKPPQAPSVVPNKGGKAAGIAYMFDSVLRGAMKGREQAQQQQSYKANKLMQGFQYAYQNASQQYIGMIQNDPELAKKLGELNTITSAKSPTPEQQARAKELSSDPTVVKAQQVSTAADSAWQAMQRMYNNYLNPDAQKKSKSSSSGSGSGSSKSKGGDQSGKNDGENPVQLIQSQNKQDQLRGYLAISQAVGPGYKREAAYYMSPQYQQQVKNAQGEQTITGDVQDKRLELHKLQNADPSTLDDKSKQRLNQLQTDPELFPEMSHTTPHYSAQDIPGSSLAAAKDPYGNPVRDKFGNAIDPKQNYRLETLGGVQSYVPSVDKSMQVKPGTIGAFFESVANESNIPVNELSSESQLGLQRAFAQSKQLGHVVGTYYVYQDKETGQIVSVPMTRTTSGGKIEVPAVTKGGSGNQPSTATGGQNPTQHRGGTSGTSGAGGAGGTSAGDGSESSTPPDGSPHGARVIGHTLSGPQAKSQATTADTYKKMKPLFGLLGAQEDYMKEIEKDPSKASARQDLSLIVAAVRSMNPGSVRLPTKELELEMKAGSYGDQFQRWYDKASTGLLPDDQRKDLFTIVKRETSKAGESIAADWQQYMSGQPLPSDIKRFAKDGGGAGSGTSSGTNSGTSGSGMPGTPSKLTPEQQKALDDAFPKQQ